MVNMQTIQALIHGIFQQSGKSTMSKQEIIGQAQKAPNGAEAMPMLNKLPEKPNYNESGVIDQVKNLMGKGGVVGKIRSKIGV